MKLWRKNRKYVKKDKTCNLRLQSYDRILCFAFRQAEKIFAEVRQRESHHVQGMEIYSTTLWQLEREVALSALAHDLTEYDKEIPEVSVRPNALSIY